MKVLFVCNNAFTPGNGLSASARNTIRELREHGIDARLMAVRNPDPAGPQPDFPLGHFKFPVFVFLCLNSEAVENGFKEVFLSSMTIAKMATVSEEDWTRMISKISYMIKTVNEKEFNTFNEKLEYLENLSYYDFEYFNKIYTDIINSFGIERNVISTCPECGNTNEVYVYISPEFFRLI